jgi:murein DD-endopeptidase MepM/ murein hydrolase activator NlpD
MMDNGIHNSHRYIAFIGVLILTVSGACQRSPAKPTPTPVIAGFTETSPPSLDETSTPTLEPFRFDLPAPGAPPVSGWRPPLYSVPWAVAPFDHFYFTRPIGADQVNWPLANYRYGGVFDPPFVHTGVDIDAPFGTPILAAGPGTVVWADWGLLLEAPGDHSDPYGQAVVIRMDFGYKGQQLYSVYAHMSKIIAIVGQHVDTGEMIGLVGATGHVTGPHVHFEIRLGVNSFYYTYNPELWMAPPEGWGVLVGRITDTNNDTLQQLEVTIKNIYTGDTHIVKTYGPGPVNHDPVYNENMVIGDLPAGVYKVTFSYASRQQQEWMYIYPGQVTYFTFRGTLGFNIGAPPTPALKFLPTTTPKSP